MTAGALRHRVVVEQTTESQSASGAVSDTWTAFATRWASIEALTGRERFEAQQLDADVDYRIEMRFLAGVTPKMRVKFGTRLFDIGAAFDPKGRKRKLVILAKEEV